MIKTVKKLVSVAVVAVLSGGLLCDVPQASAKAGFFGAFSSVSSHRSQPYRDSALGDVDVYDSVKDVPDVAVFEESGGPLPAMQPVTRDNKWVNRYGWHDLGLARKLVIDGNRYFDMPTLSRDVTMADLQDLHYRMSYQIIQALPKWGKTYEWIYEDNRRDDDPLETPNGVYSWSVGLTCFMHYPCWLSGRKKGYKQSLHTGYGASFSTWDEVKESLMRVYGYLRYLGADVRVEYAGVGDWVVNVILHASLYPVNSMVPFNIEVTVATPESEGGKFIAFVISSPFIPAETDGAEIPQRMPNTIIH